MSNRSFILTLTCPDTLGIVNAVSGWLLDRECNILESAQFGDPDTGLLAMRIRFHAEETVTQLHLVCSTVTAPADGSSSAG